MSDLKTVFNDWKSFQEMQKLSNSINSAIIDLESILNNIFHVL